mgnify:CR=1 FL=1
MPEKQNTTPTTKAKRGAIVDLRPAIAIAEAQKLHASAEALLRERKANAELNVRVTATVAACRVAANAPAGSDLMFTGCQAFAIPERRNEDIASASKQLETASAQLFESQAKHQAGVEKVLKTFSRILSIANGKGRERTIDPNRLLQEFVGCLTRNFHAKKFDHSGGFVSAKSYDYPYASTTFTARRIGPGRYSCIAERARYWPDSGKRVKE